MSLVANGFAHAAANAVADYGFAQCAWSGESETGAPGKLGGGGQVEYRKAWARHARPLIVHFAKFTGL